MRLVVQRGGKRQILESKSAEIYAGRAKENEIVLEDHDSSERHCRIFRVDSGYHLSDLETAIGTRLNGRVVKEAALHPGDRIEIGETVILFEPGAMESPQETGLYLESVEGGLKGKTFEVSPEPLTFGRLKKNRVVLTDPGVSNYHAIVTLEAEGAVVTDLKSTNGSWVNGKRVEREALRPGDRLALMGAVFVLRDRSGKSARPPVALEGTGRKVSEGRTEGTRPRPARSPLPTAKTTAAAGPGGEAAPDDNVLEFDYDLLLEETSRTSVAQTAGIVVILLLIIGFGSVVLRGILVQPPADPGPSGNLLGNWSFEREGGWAFVSPATGERDPEEQKGGKQSLRIDLASTAGEEAVIRAEETRPVLEGRTLQARAWLKLDGPSVAGLRLRWISDGDPGYSKVSLASLLVGPTDWDEVEGSFLPPPGASRVQVECFVLGPPSRTAWVDRVRLIEWDESEDSPEVTSKGSGVRFRHDRKGVGDLWRNGSPFVEGLDIQVGEGPFGFLSAATPVRGAPSAGLSLKGRIYHEEEGHWDDVTVTAEEDPKGISITYSIPQETPSPRIRLHFHVASRSVGGSGPVLGSETSEPKARPWEVKEEMATEVVLGERKRILSLSFSSPLKVSSGIDGDRVGFVLEAEPALLAKEGSTVLTVRASPVSPLMEGRAMRALEVARGLKEQGPWVEAVAHLERLIRQSSSLPEVVREAKQMQERIQEETRRRLEEIDALLADYLELQVPRLAQEAILRIDALQDRWQGGTVAGELKGRREAAQAILDEVEARRYEALASLLYTRGRSHMDAGSFELASLLYGQIQKDYPESAVMAKVGIDLEQISKSKEEAP